MNPDTQTALNEAVKLGKKSIMESFFSWSAKKFLLWIALVLLIFLGLLVVRMLHVGGLIGIAMSSGLLLANKLVNYPILHKNKF